MTKAVQKEEANLQSARKRRNLAEDAERQDLNRARSLPGIFREEDARLTAIKQRIETTIIDGETLSDADVAEMQANQTRLDLLNGAIATLMEFRLPTRRINVLDAIASEHFAEAAYLRAICVEEKREADAALEKIKPQLGEQTILSVKNSK